MASIAATPTTPLDLSIVIAAFREAESLAMLLPRINAAAAALTPRFEVLVVDSQQPLDNTAEVCAANGAQHIHRCGGNSYGDAVRTIIAQARGQHVLNMDADGSHDPAFFAALWAERTHSDIVIGSRYAQGGASRNPARLILLSYLVNLTFRAAFPINAKDVTNSFRLYHRDILASLHLESNDFDILEEILVKAMLRSPLPRITEVPVTFARRQAGQSKRKLVALALGYLKTLLRLRSFVKASRPSR